MDRHEVRPRHQLVEADQIDTELPRAVSGHERVVGDEAHPECTGALGDELADAPEPDHAEGLVSELDSLPPAALPPSLREGGVCLWNVAGLREQQCHRLLGRREDVRLRRVDHHHALAGGVFDVDVVEPDAGSAHDNEVGGRVDDVGGHLRRRPDDECVRSPHRREQLLR